MGFPLFRVTLSNDIEGSLVISEPGGWDDAKLKLERNMEFHSLVEFYDQPLMFYGQDSQNNGGLDYIRNIEQTQGIDAQVTILIEISNDDGGTYETCVEQTLEIESVKETDFYKAEFGVIRNGFWQNFMNRKGTPVDLLSTTDLDGQIREVINAITIQLPSQKIQEIFYATENDGVAFLIEEDNYGMYTPSIIEVSELMEVFVLPSTQSTTLPVWIFEPEFDGVYNFDLLIEYSGTTIQGYDSAPSIDFFIKVNDEAPIEATYTNVNYVDASVYSQWSGGPPSNSPNVGTTIAEINETVTLFKGAQVRIYLKQDGSVTGRTITFWGKNGASGIRPIDGIQVVDPATKPSGMAAEPTYFIVTGNTTYNDTDCEGFFIHEAGNAITDRIIGRDGTFYSEHLGNTQTQIQSYSEDGCGSKYAVTRGLNVRGYTLAEKPFFMSFDTWWNGINPLLNLGLGYETIGSPELEVLRIEQKRYFYNPITSVDFDFVNNIERSYNPDFVFKAIEIGFEKWSAESASGVDDPQSKRVYNTRFKTVGREIKILSKFIGASLAIEQTRRNRVEQGKDWRLDEDVMIIAMNLDGSPEFQPELDENFTEVTNLLNPETRYNIRLSVARNFERWKDFFNGCLQWYVDDSPEEEYRFASGEGNFDMTSTLEAADCEAEGVSPEQSLSEKQNIAVTDDFLFMPIVYTFEHPMTWQQYKTIRENRSNAIGVSRTDENHISCYIMELEYQLTHGRATFTVILGEHAYL